MTNDKETVEKVELGAFMADHADAVMAEAVKVARQDLALSDSDNVSRVEKECRQIFARCLPQDRKPEGDTPRLRLSLPAYLRAMLAIREGLIRVIETTVPPDERVALATEASISFGQRMLRAVLLDAEKRDGESVRQSALIDELEEAKEKLQRTIDHLTKLFEYSPDGIVTLDADGTVMTINKAAKSITGYRASEIVGVEFTKLLADEKSARNLFKRMRKRWVSNYETVLSQKDGKETPITISASILETPDEDDPHMMVMFRDLSEVEEMKAQLIESEKLAAMAKIAGAVAHEIRNPLNSLFLNTDLLEDEIGRGGAKISERSQHLLNVVREEIDRLNSIIVNYLSLGRVARLAPVATDVNAFLSETLAEKRGDLEDAGVKLVERFAKGLPQLYIDANQMRRVVFNLVQNSINAMPDGGELTVATRSGKDDTVILEIADRGIGIASEHMENIFNPFFSRIGGGTGLGLYLSREIIVTHQGMIALKSEPGKGTSVIVTMPVLDEWEDR